MPQKKGKKKLSKHSDTEVELLRSKRTRKKKVIKGGEQLDRGVVAMLRFLFLTMLQYLM